MLAHSLLLSHQGSAWQSLRTVTCKVSNTSRARPATPDGFPAPESRRDAGQLFDSHFEWSIAGEPPQLMFDLASRARSPAESIAQSQYQSNWLPHRESATRDRTPARERTTPTAFVLQTARHLFP